MRCHWSAPVVPCLSSHCIVRKLMSNCLFVSMYFSMRRSFPYFAHSASDIQELAALRTQRTLWEEDRTRLEQTQQLTRAQEDKISRLSRLNEKMTGELKDLHAMVDLTLRKVTGGTSDLRCLAHTCPLFANDGCVRGLFAS